MITGSKRRAADAGTRFELYSRLSLTVQVIFMGMLIARHYLLHQPNSPAMGLDYAVYWSAARVALQHGAAAIYSPLFMQPLETMVRPYMDYTPWPYPPTFLPWVLPLGQLSFGWAQTIFISGSLLLYVCGVYYIGRGANLPVWRYALGFPAVFVVISFGQNSFLTAAIAAAALAALPTRPILAGAFIALLSIKPQLGILFPIFLACTRQWRCFASAAIFTLLYNGACLAAFGTSAFLAFWSALGQFNQHWVTHDSHNLWPALTSVYGVMRMMRATSSIANFTQAIYALLAVNLCIRLWLRHSRYELQAAALSVSALMVIPYIVVYDLSWLIVPIAFLTVDMMRHGASKFEITWVALTWLTPLQGMVARWIPDIYQWAPVTLLGLLLVIVHRSSIHGSTDMPSSTALRRQTWGRKRITTSRVS